MFLCFTKDDLSIAIIVSMNNYFQFESIHPFYDANGRTGRIINILYLVLKDLLNLPVLYLSRYIIQNKDSYTPLEKELCRGFEKRKIPFLVGGGLGIYFKQVHLEYKLDHKPVIDRENWGPPRTTNDIDLYLLYEVIADKEKFGEVRTFLDEAGYEVLEQGKYFQFQKNISGQDVKIDVMAGNLSKDQKLHTGGLFRVRNKVIKNLHALIA